MIAPENEKDFKYKPLPEIGLTLIKIIPIREKFDQRKLIQRIRISH